MNPMIIGGIVEAAGEVLDDLITSDEERRAADLEELRLQNEMRMAELEADTRRFEAVQHVNEAEARHSSLFVSGWRPGAGWVTIAGMFIVFVFYPVTGIVTALARGEPLPDPYDITDLMMLLASLLGHSYIRSREKEKGVARDRL